MREILFRGKVIGGEEFIYGDYIRATPIPLIRVTEDNRSAYFGVVPDTIGQYTGLTDKNGKKIFEGDIVGFAGDLDFIDGKFAVVFDEFCRWMIVANKGHYLLARNNEDVEVIGNIHENPELLKGGG